MNNNKISKSFWNGINWMVDQIKPMIDFTIKKVQKYIQQCIEGYLTQKQMDFVNTMYDSVIDEKATSVSIGNDLMEGYVDSYLGCFITCRWKVNCPYYMIGRCVGFFVSPYVVRVLHLSVVFKVGMFYQLVSWIAPVASSVGTTMVDYFKETLIYKRVTCVHEYKSTECDIMIGPCPKMMEKRGVTYFSVCQLCGYETMTN